MERFCLTAGVPSASKCSDFTGWCRSGNAGMIDEQGDVSVMGRTDDIINTAGHRLSTGAIGEVLGVLGRD